MTRNEIIATRQIAEVKILEASLHATLNTVVGQYVNPSIQEIRMAMDYASKLAHDLEFLCIEVHGYALESIELANSEAF